MKRISYLLALTVALFPACLGEATEPLPSVWADTPSPPPSPAPTAAPPARLVLMSVYQGSGDERLRVSSYVQDTRLRAPVAPAAAEDGFVRWLPIEDWAPSALPVPASTHSAALGLYLDSACRVGFAITPAQTRPRFVWQPVGPSLDLRAVWRIGDNNGQAAEVSANTMWSADGTSCRPLDPSEQRQALAGHGAWTLGEKLPAEGFVAAEFSARAEPPGGILPLMTMPPGPPLAAARKCQRCNQKSPTACGGVPTLCDCSSGRCCCR